MAEKKGVSRKGRGKDKDPVTTDPVDEKEPVSTQPVDPEPVSTQPVDETPRRDPVSTDPPEETEPVDDGPPAVSDPIPLHVLNELARDGYNALKYPEEEE